MLCRGSSLLSDHVMPDIPFTIKQPERLVGQVVLLATFRTGYNVLLRTCTNNMLTLDS